MPGVSANFGRLLVDTNAGRFTGPASHGQPTLESLARQIEDLSRSVANTAREIQRAFQTMAIEVGAEEMTVMTDFSVDTNTATITFSTARVWVLKLGDTGSTNIVGTSC